MDWNDLKQYIGKDSSDEDAYIESCYDLAVIQVDEAFKTAFKPVPVDVLERCYLEVGLENYNRKSAPSGSSMFTGYEGGAIPVRGPRDPLTMIRPIIAMYVVPF